MSESQQVSSQLSTAWGCKPPWIDTFICYFQCYINTLTSLFYGGSFLNSWWKIHQHWNSHHVTPQSHRSRLDAITLSPNTAPSAKAVIMICQFTAKPRPFISVSVTLNCGLSIGRLNFRFWLGFSWPTILRCQFFTKEKPGRILFYLTFIHTYCPYTAQMCCHTLLTMVKKK